MTLAQWHSNSDRRVELSRLVETEPLKSALQILVSEGLPKGGVVSPSDMEANAMLNARREGFYEFYHALHGLTQTPAEPKQAAAPQPWKYKGRKRSPEETE